MNEYISVAYRTFAMQATGLLRLDSLGAQQQVKTLLQGTNGNSDWNIRPDIELPNDFYINAVKLGWGAFENGRFQIYALGKQVAGEAIGILSTDDAPELA